MAEVGLSDVMEHLAVAFGGIYEKLTERDQEVAALHERLDDQGEYLASLSHRIESHYRSLSDRIEHATDVAAGRDARRSAR